VADTGIEPDEDALTNHFQRTVPGPNQTTLLLKFEKMGALLRNTVMQCGGSSDREKAAAGFADY
jgi:hypothetical protein